MINDLSALRRAVADREGLLERWIAELVRRTWQLSGRRNDLQQLRERCGTIADALHATLAGDCDCDGAGLGSPEWREPVQLLSFTAGWLAGAGLPIGAALALAQGLRDAAGGGPERFFDDLATVVTEAYAAGTAQQAAARHRQVIEKSQVVCLLGERLPGLFLVGDPDRQALDDAIARLMMVAVMRQAPVMIVDASGLIAPEVSLPEALRILADHRREPPPRLVLTSVTQAMMERISTGDRPARITSYERLEEALAAVGEPAAVR